MRNLLFLAAALVIGIGAIGCADTTTTGKKVEVTTKTPEGESKSTVEQKVETTPDSQTKTTTQKTETNP